MGQQMAQAMSAAQTTPLASPASQPPSAGLNAGSPAPAAALPELLSPGDAAKALGVSESDVLAALADGSLKGKKIGAAWRITRAALEDFLKS
jgi:excisionase family DNA binding protein